MISLQIPIGISRVIYARTPLGNAPGALGFPTAIPHVSILGIPSDTRLFSLHIPLEIPLGILHSKFLLGFFQIFLQRFRLEFILKFLQGFL